MKQKHLCGITVNKIAVFLLALCGYCLISSIGQCVLLLKGAVEINLAVGGSAMEKVLLNGETFTKGWLTPHDQIFLTVPETAGVPTVAYIAVLLIGFVRILPVMSGTVLFGLFLIRLLTGELFSKRNVSLLCATGTVFVLSSLIIPLLNGFVIPRLITMLSSVTLQTGVDTTSILQVWRGAAVWLLASILKLGCEREEKLESFD